MSVFLRDFGVRTHRLAGAAKSLISLEVLVLLHLCTMSFRQDPSVRTVRAAHDPAADAELVRAILRGDPRAPSVVWGRYAQLVRRIVRRALGPDHDVEDVVQDVFLGVFAKVSGLRDHEALRPFIVSVAIRCVRYAIRRRRVRRLVGLAPAAQLAELRVVHPDAAPRQALARFYAILDKLSSRDRAAFILRHVEDMTDAEVASALGVSIATARRSCARAYERVAVHARIDPFLSELLPPLEEQP